MAVNIDEFKRYVEFVSNKVQSGNSVTPSQFNELAHRAQMQVFEKDRAVFVGEEIASDYLKNFLKRKTFTGPFLAGEFSLPIDFEHTNSMRSYRVKNNGTTNEREIREVKNADWGEILGSSLFEADNVFPKFSQFKKTMRVLPKTLNTVTLEYFATPPRPLWAFTTVSGRPVYDAANSVDFVWDQFAMNNVAAYYLALIGVNLKDTELAQFSQVYKQETNSVI